MKRNFIEGRYFFSKKTVRRIFYTLDWLLLLVAWIKPKPEKAENIQKVLICNGAHLGDVVMATSIAAEIKKLLPHVEIGMLIGSWSLAVLKTNELVDHVHLLDHWTINRAKTHKLRKFFQYWRTYFFSLNEVRRKKYDIAIDSYFFFPNSAGFIWMCGIPIRVGFRSGGFWRLYTHSRDWGPANRHMIEHYKDLLKLVPLPSSIDRSANLRPALGLIKEVEALDVASRSALATLPKSYLVFHPGSGEPQKEWPAAKWRELLCQMRGIGTVVFTGSGERESSLIASICQDENHAINLAGKLSWSGYLHLVSKATTVVSVDSVAAHVASAFNVPNVMLGHGMTDQYLWAPLANGSIRIINAVPCVPCFKKNGCEPMNCIRGIGTDDILAYLRSQLESIK